MTKWEPKFITFKSVAISEELAKQLLAELAELFYKGIASSENLKKPQAIGAPLTPIKEVAS